MSKPIESGRAGVRDMTRAKGILTRGARGSGPDDDASAGALMQRVGARVRDVRRKQGMSRRELSEASGVSPRYLAQLEAGAGNISIGLLQRVALALGDSVEALVREHRIPTAELPDLMDLLQTADTATRARILNILDPANARRQKAERVCLIGLRGAGKSTLGNLIARDLGLPFVELTSEVEARASLPVAEIIALYGQDGYREMESTALDDVTHEKDRVVLAVAGGIVADERVFATVLRRFHTIWVQASAAEHMERVRAQGDLRPMAGNPQAMSQLQQILTERAALYGQAEHRLDTTGRTVAESFAQLQDLIFSRRILGGRA